MATTTALSVGYVQPERNRRNDLSLSRARARRVVAALPRMTGLDRITVSGRGRARQWRLVQG